MARVWIWTENFADYDPETGAFIRLHLHVFAGQPRFPGDPTLLTELQQTEEPGQPPTFAMRVGESTLVPYASQAALIAAYNETVIERLQLEPEPNE